MRRLSDVAKWRGDDWKNTVGNVVMGVFRAGVALGIGLGDGAVKERTT